MDARELARLDWVPRADVLQALAAYDGSRDHREARECSVAAVGFFLPPPHAMAHKLLRGWARAEAWWPRRDGGSVAAGASGDQQHPRPRL